MKIRAFLTLVGAVSCFAVAACSSDSTGGTGGGGGNATTATGTGGNATTSTGTAGGGTGGNTTTTGTGGAGGGTGACATCGMIAQNMTNGLDACPGSQDLADALLACACDPNGCATDCADACNGGDTSAACNTCVTNPSGPCGEELTACAGDTGQ